MFSTHLLQLVPVAGARPVGGEALHFTVSSYGEHSMNLATATLGTAIALNGHVLLHSGSEPGHLVVRGACCVSMLRGL